MSTGERIRNIKQAIQYWLSDHDGRLTAAIDRSAGEEGVVRHDIFHRLQEIEQSLSGERLEKWAERVGVPDDAPGNPVLCLHAGNLPLVAFQDVIAVLLSGNFYLGKISRKDRHLTESFLGSLADHGFNSQLTYSTAMTDLPVARARAVMFSGSETTVQKVWQKLHELGCSCPPEHRLIRTASYSVARMVRCSDRDLHHLAEAMLRYGGNGCRSVRVIISPVPLSEIKTRLEVAIEHWKANKETDNGADSRRLYAFARAAGKTAIDAGDKIIMEGEGLPDYEETVIWQQGDRQELRDHLQNHGPMVQNVYIEDDAHLPPEIDDIRIDYLEKAQSPDPDWQPDGVDPLDWLVQVSS